MPEVVPPSSSFDWDKLAFDLYKTNGYVKYVWSGGAWGKAEWVKEPYLTLHVGNVAINYGQSVFEGLKAFRHQDGHVRLFRPQENAARINHSAAMVAMPELPESVFLEAVSLAVGRNLEFVPPYSLHGSKGSLYVRPLMFGSGPQLILNPPSEFTFIVYVTPTGSLYGAAGTAAPAVDGVVLESFDRSAPKGTGTAKLAGNYAPVFRHAAAAKRAGYAITLHLDSATRTHVDEFSTSNFVALTPPGEDGKPTLVLPSSPSILKSITAKSIVDIAKSFGYKVENRPVLFEEVKKGAFAEVAACGTAAAITPIRSISYQEPDTSVKKILIGDGETAGPGFLAFLSELTGLQSGDKTGAYASEWCWPKEGLDGSA